MDLSAKMISTGYFQWDDMYIALKEDNSDFVKEMFDEIYDMDKYVSSISIIEDTPKLNDELYLINRMDKNLVIDFKVYNGLMTNSLNDQFIRVIFKVDEILNDIQFSDTFYFGSGKQSYNFLYSLKVKSKEPVIFMFQIISALGIGFLCSLILKRVFYTHTHFFYETRGLEKIIFLFEQTEKYSANHSKHVATIAQFLGRKYGLKRKVLKDLEVAALLHDIGKISIPREILNKESELTDKEYEVVKEHTILSDNIIKNFEELSHLRYFIKHHHEKMDGTGYPSGLKGDQIPLESRIIAIADIFEALIGERPYREPIEPVAAVRFMKNMSLDKDILSILENHLHEICKKIHKGIE